MVDMHKVCPKTLVLIMKTGFEIDPMKNNLVGQMKLHAISKAELMETTMNALMQNI